MTVSFVAIVLPLLVACSSAPSEDEGSTENSTENGTDVRVDVDTNESVQPKYGSWDCYQDCMKPARRSAGWARFCWKACIE